MSASDGRLGSGKRVLVVDDEYEMRYLTRAFLQHGFPGMELVEAASGQEGMALLARERFDIVVSDYRMPRMDGLAFLDQASSTVPLSACILMTAYQDHVVQRRAQALGLRFIDKGGDPQDIVAAVRGLLVARQERTRPGGVQV